MMDWMHGVGREESRMTPTSGFGNWGCSLKVESREERQIQGSKEGMISLAQGLLGWKRQWDAQGRMSEWVLDRWVWSLGERTGLETVL